MLCLMPTSTKLPSRFSAASAAPWRAICPTAPWSRRLMNCSALSTRKRPAMPRADRGSVWIVDLGLTVKVRPGVVLSVPTDPQDRVLVTLVPHTTSVQGTRFEVAVQAKFLHGGGVFDAQQI